MGNFVTKDEKYAKDMERGDYERLKFFNSCKLFLKELGPTEEMSAYDASGLTSTSQLAVIELKRRDMYYENGILRSQKGYTASTIFIEAHKAADLYFEAVCHNAVPLYVNFLEGETIVVYNLMKLAHRPKKTAKRIYSRLYQGFELAKRQELDLKDAYIYVWEDGRYKCLQNPSTPTE